MKLADMLFHYTQGTITDSQLTDYFKVWDITDEDRKQFFHDYGCVNDFLFSKDSKQRSKALEFAGKLHAADAERHPELHDEHDDRPWRCYHKHHCSCGFAWEVDSSD